MQAYLVNTGIQNDEVVWWIPLSAGTWDLKFDHFGAAANRGIATIAIDNADGVYVDVGTVDMSLVGDGATATITGITVAGNALRRRMRVKMATKNVSSSAYYACIHGFTWQLTSTTGVTPATQSPFEALLRSYGTGRPTLMLDSQTSGHLSQAADQTPMITGHTRGPAAFDGKFDRIHVPDDALLDATTYSVVTVFATPLGQRQLCSRWAVASGNLCWAMDTSGSGDKVRFYAQDTVGASVVATSTGTVVSNNAKHMAVGTFDSSKIARLYVDADAVVATAAMSGTPRNNAATANMTIGGTRDSEIIENNTGDGFYGRMAAFAYLPGVVLSQAQIDALRALM
jgi:hypothetical protein